MLRSPSSDTSNLPDCPDAGRVDKSTNATVSLGLQTRAMSSWPTSRTWFVTFSLILIALIDKNR